MRHLAYRQLRRAARAAAGGTLAALMLTGALSLPLPLAAQTSATGREGPALAPTRPPRLETLRPDGTPRSTTTRPAGARLPPMVLAPSDQIAQSRDAATLLADRVTLTGPRSVTAEGGVVIWYQNRRLVASRVSYDGATDRLIVTGPIHLSTPAERGTSSEMVLIADSADLSDGMRDGILRGARLVLAREMQLAAREAHMQDGGRVVTLDRVVASSCQICAENPTPLWEIRARRITHDRDSGRISFERPQFRAFGLPVASLPWLTAPDPAVERMTGFLTPRFRTTSNLGPGIKLPYFITLGPSADLTLTPYLSASRTTTLEVRYRQALSFGAIELQGAISRDDLTDERSRGYLFGATRFDLPGEWWLDAQVQTASDRAYLLDYGITDADRLWSGISLGRVSRDELVASRFGEYRSLREDESRATAPAQVADLLWQRRFRPNYVGGEAVVEWSAHAHRRPSSEDILGRDVARATLGAAWRRSEVLPGGLLLSGETRLDAEFYGITQDSRFDSRRLRITPAAAIALRWPLVRHEAGGASQVLEPVVQLVWSPELRESDRLPNEDSQLWEFDEGNLFAFSRYPGRDARESGLRANIGLGWTRFDPEGWSVSMAAGRVIRAREARPIPGMLPDDIAPREPLFEGKRSDWVLSGNYASGTGLALAGRALISDSARISRAELRAGWLRPGLQLSAGYLWMDRASEPGRGADLSELVLETGWQLAPGWWATTDTRYDFSMDRAQKAAFGLTYRNECVAVEMGIERRFVSGDALRPETNFDLSVRLGGFGRPTSDGTPGTVARRACLR